MDRRTLLKTVVAAGAVGTAGCTEPNDTMNQNQTAETSQPSSSQATAIQSDHQLSISNVGFSAWELTDTQGSSVGEEDTDNPVLELQVGDRYEIVNQAGNAHPLAFRDDAGEPLLSQAATGAFEDDSQINWVEDGNAVGFTYTDALASRVTEYYCTAHAVNMAAPVVTQSA